MIVVNVAAWNINFLFSTQSKHFLKLAYDLSKKLLLLFNNFTLLSNLSWWNVFSVIFVFVVIG